ncbi:hypothetical protein AGMMS49982_18620 [Bacteroidia bacterium]|nr:hypothetical protein AGMMS49982_18620 [Bacteroidia bacterium]
MARKTKISFNVVTINWSYGSVCDFLIRASKGCVFFVDWGNGKATKHIGQEEVMQLQHNYNPRVMIPKEEIVYHIKILSEDENCLFTLLDVSHYEMRFSDIDVSRCTELEVLTCKWNGITTLDLRKNEALQVLDCEYNGLTNLLLGNCSKLKEVHCIEGNKLKEPMKRWIERLIAAQNTK